MGEQLLIQQPAKGSQKVPIASATHLWMVLLFIGSSLVDATDRFRSDVDQAVDQKRLVGSLDSTQSL